MQRSTSQGMRLLVPSCLRLGTELQEQRVPHVVVSLDIPIAFESSRVA